MNYFEDINPDLFLYILNQTPYQDILALCKANRHYNSMCLSREGLSVINDKRDRYFFPIIKDVIGKLIGIANITDFDEIMKGNPLKGMTGIQLSDVVKHRYKRVMYDEWEDYFDRNLETLDMVIKLIESNLNIQNVNAPKDKFYYLLILIEKYLRNRSVINFNHAYDSLLNSGNMIAYINAATHSDQKKNEAQTVFKNGIYKFLSLNPQVIKFIRQLIDKVHLYSLHQVPSYMVPVFSGTEIQQITGRAFRR